MTHPRGPHDALTTTRDALQPKTHHLNAQNTPCPHRSQRP
jgi:hypothetical protein